MLYSKPAYKLVGAAVKAIMAKCFVSTEQEGFFSTFIRLYPVLKECHGCSPACTVHITDLYKYFKVMAFVGLRCQKVNQALVMFCANVAMVLYA